jgi:hypothetical protein
MKLSKLALLGIVQLKSLRFAFNTHCSIIYALGFSRSFYNVFCRRFNKFHFSCMNSFNSTVSFLTRRALSYARTLSPHVRIMFSIQHLPMLTLQSHGFTCASQFLDEWCARKLTKDDALSISVLFEWLMIRSDVYEFADCVQVFDHHEIEIGINEQCVACI